MSDQPSGGTDPGPVPFDAGAFAPDPGPRITAIEVIALALTVLWLAAVSLFLFLPREVPEGGPTWPGLVMTMLAVILPIAMIWVAAAAARTARVLRAEAARLQASIDAVRGSIETRRAVDGGRTDPDVVRKLEEIAAAQERAQVQLASFTSLRAAAQPAVAPTRPAMDGATMAEPPQPSLGLGTPAEALEDPVTVAEFIKALNFPDNERDKDGFRTLRKALRDRSTQRLVRASQDVLTLLSQDGIYMDDLRPDRARPEVWRRFAKGERGRQIAGLGGVHDRSSLALASGRMKQDPVFRDATHHFLRHFDHTFMDFERHATDEDIVRLADTRTARAFMLLGRVTGTFD